MTGVTSGPSPVPGLLPPCHPSASEVGDGRIGERGRVTLLPLGGSCGGVRAAELPLGGTGGGVRAAELPLGGTNYAQPGEGERGPSPFPLVLPPSHPILPQVGDGRCAKSQRKRLMNRKDGKKQRRMAPVFNLAPCSLQQKLQLISVCNL